MARRRHGDPCCPLHGTSWKRGGSGSRWRYPSWEAVGRSGLRRRLWGNDKVVGTNAGSVVGGVDFRAACPSVGIGTHCHAAEQRLVRAVRFAEVLGALFDLTTCSEPHVSAEGNGIAFGEESMQKSSSSWH